MRRSDLESIWLEALEDRGGETAVKSAPAPFAKQAPDGPSSRSELQRSPIH